MRVRRVGVLGAAAGFGAGLLGLARWPRMCASASVGEEAVLKVSELRKEYGSRGLEEAAMLSDPVEMFREWLSEAVASGLVEPNGMVLATCDPESLQPSSRVVLLKGLEEEGAFLWFSNYGSRKGEELEKNPRASLTFWWAELERSVRIEGFVEKVSAEETERYFNSRPRGSQMGAWVSQQSKEIESRGALERKMLEVQARFENQSQIPVPPYWGGYRLKASRIEFWKGRGSRLHDRIEFSRHLEKKEWRVRRLQP